MFDCPTIKKDCIILGLSAATGSIEIVRNWMQSNAKTEPASYTIASP